jgi:hypothetical protein
MPTTGCSRLRSHSGCPSTTSGHGPRPRCRTPDGHREHRRALFRVRAAAAEGLQRRLRLPALEDVDTAGVDQVRADRDVEAANCPARLDQLVEGRVLFDDAHTAREVGLANRSATQPEPGEHRQIAHSGPSPHRVRLKETTPAGYQEPAV